MYAVEVDTGNSHCISEKNLRKLHSTARREMGSVHSLLEDHIYIYVFTFPQTMHTYTEAVTYRAAESRLWQ